MGDIANIGGFNANDVDQLQEFTPIPNGVYTAIVAEASVHATKAATGHYVKTKLQIVDGEFSGRTLYEYFNISNQNAKCQSIGKAQFGELCRAMSLTEISDTSEIVDKAIAIKVSSKNETYNGQTRVVNVIKGYAVATATAAPAPAPAQPSQTDGCPF